MKLLAKILMSLAILAAVTFVATFPVAGSYASRAQLIQRVKPSEESALFGEKGDLIGSPQRLIIDDPKAMIEGEGPDGSKLVNDQYLQENKIYPLQLQTVDYVAGLVRIGSAIGFAVMLAGFFLARRKG